MNARLAPSILSADFARLADEIAAVERGGADLLHLDVMDGHFVPNLTIGPMVVRSIRRVTGLPLDVHLMITDPDRYIEAFATAGASMISVHAEASPDLARTVEAIRTLGCRPGAVINPPTEPDVLRPVAALVDYVVVMSVNPGFGGQSFLPESESKVRAVRRLLDGAGNRGADIEIDGGIDLTNAGRVVACGVSIVVAGASIFEHDDPEAAARQLRAAALAGAAA